MTDIGAITAAHTQAAVAHALPEAPVNASAGSLSFSDMIANGLHHVETQVNEANDLVRAFAVDDSIPVHQVTIALEQARLSIDLALQVRTKLVDAFHEIMGMQL